VTIAFHSVLVVVEDAVVELRQFVTSTLALSLSVTAYRSAAGTSQLHWTQRGQAYIPTATSYNV